MAEFEGRDFREGNHSAGWLIGDGFGNGWIGSAKLAVGIFFNLEFPEGGIESAVVHQPSKRWPAESGEKLNRFHRLQTSNDTREHAQDTGFSSCRDCSFGRGLWKEAAVARAAEVGSEDGELALELEDGAVNERLFEKEGGVVGREAGGEVIGAVEDCVVGLEKLQ